MRDRVLAIVSIIAKYVMEDRDQMSESDIVEELLSVGFEEEEIDAAFNWMENFSLHPDPEPEPRMTLPTTRVFTLEERCALSSEARGFLVRLRALGILDNDSQEEIIDKAMELVEDEVSLREVKALTALTLFSRSQDQWRREIDCFMEDDWSRLHH